MLQPPTKFEVRRRHTFGFSINRPGDDLLTLKLVRIIARGVGNLPTNFGVCETSVIDLSANTCRTHRMTLQH